MIAEASAMHEAIQIAGISNPSEAHMLIAAGVDYLGFPLRLHDGREDLSEPDAAAIIRNLKPGTNAVCITYLDTAAEIAELCDRMATTWVQLHGPIPIEELTALKSSRPALNIIKSLIVRSDNRDTLERELHEFAPHVDAFITDTFDPATGRSGATGKTHDWTRARRLVERSRKPIILAGGLGPDNVREAIAQVHPAGVDAHTRVERPDGSKDPSKVARFVSEAREGFRDCR